MNMSRPTAFRVARGLYCGSLLDPIPVKSLLRVPNHQSTNLRFISHRTSNNAASKKAAALSAHKKQVREDFKAEDDYYHKWQHYVRYRRLPYSAASSTLPNLIEKTDNPTRFVKARRSAFYRFFDFLGNYEKLLPAKAVELFRPDAFNGSFYEVLLNSLIAILKDS